MGPGSGPERSFTMTAETPSSLEIVRGFMKDMQGLDYARAVQRVAADLEYVNPRQSARP